MDDTEYEEYENRNYAYNAALRSLESNRAPAEKYSTSNESFATILAGLMISQALYRIAATLKRFRQVN
jgi:hypothetical protein